MSFYKNGIASVLHPQYENLYTGTQYNYSNASLTYNYETDLFKDYGYNTCLRIGAVSSPSYYNTSTQQFLAYSYLLNPTIEYELGQEYAFSMLAYVPSSCNANFRIHIEHSNTWISNYLGTTANINDSTKDKVIHVYGRCKASASDGKIYIMFYPNPNQANVFTTGYMYVAGITISLAGETIGLGGTGLLEKTGSSVANNRLEFNGFKEV